MIAARGDRKSWQAVLDGAEKHSTPGLRGALLQIALWHGRHDLAVPVIDAMLANGDGDENQLKRARRAYAVFGAAGKLSKLVRRK